MLPQCVVFDLGNVLLEFNYAIAIRKLIARCSLSAEQLHALIDQSPLLYKFETGLLTGPEFFAEVRKASGFGGEFHDFKILFGDIFSPIRPMIELADRLKEKGLPRFIFSNTNELAIEHIRATYPFFNDFTGYILSYEHRAMKPAPEIYRVVEQRCGHAGPEILYIDDRPENIEEGLRHGWHCILHRTPQETLEAVKLLQLL